MTPGYEPAPGKMGHPWVSQCGSRFTSVGDLRGNEDKGKRADPSRSRGPAISSWDSALGAFAMASASVAIWSLAYGRLAWQSLPTRFPWPEAWAYGSAVFVLVAGPAPGKAPAPPPGLVCAGAGPHRLAESRSGSIRLICGEPACDGHAGSRRGVHRLRIPRPVVARERQALPGGSGGWA